MRNLKLSIVVVISVVFITTAFCQDKKVAVATFYANKYVNADELAAGAANVAFIASLAKDPGFNLNGILDKFHTAFFEEFSKKFPFEVVGEESILANQQYKDYTTRDTNSIFLYNTLVKAGYNLYTVSGLYKKDLEQMITIFPEIDGFMFIELSFSLAPKIAVGGMGSAGISARANIRFWNNEKKKVMNIFEYATSKGSVPLIAGFPVLKVEKILPLCEDATDRLLLDLEKKLPKIVKKAGKKL